MSKHTKGPWYWDDGYLFSMDNRDYEVLNGTVYNKADAQLIAAAPELLEALEWVETQLVIKNVNAPDTLKRVQEAIKKARGKR